MLSVKRDLPLQTCSAKLTDIHRIKLTIFGDRYNSHTYEAYYTYEANQKSKGAC